MRLCVLTVVPLAVIVVGSGICALVSVGGLLVRLLLILLLALLVLVALLVAAARLVVVVLAVLLLVRCRVEARGLRTLGALVGRGRRVLLAGWVGPLVGARLLLLLLHLARGPALLLLLPAVTSCVSCVKQSYYKVPNITFLLSYLENFNKNLDLLNPKFIILFPNKNLIFFMDTIT